MAQQMNSNDDSSTQLKQLQFVKDAGEYVSSTGQTVYATGRSLVPNFAESTVQVVEKVVKNVTEPLLSRGEVLLQVADKQVDNVVGKFQETYNKQVEGQKESMERFKQAREQYLKKVEEAMEFVKSKGVTGTTKAGVETVQKAIVEARQQIPSLLSKTASSSIEKVTDAWNALIATQAVNKLIETTKPSVDYALGVYKNAHDVVVQDPRYSQAFQYGANVVSKVQESPVYQKISEKVSPYVSPTIEKVQSSKYYNAVVDHLKPAQVEVPPQGS
eukprot:TRINITY_DN32652_c0_g1_i1.p1 TRINITY_DN32652_c0_g1~~TRINITY_DN32652_c0_g1_i1.p1  ORF type:complete len:288 (-),score=27.48 TRINITY_DN32652_c0_g1_i1:334-1152(-)